MIGALFGRAWAYIAAGGAAVATLVGIYFAGRRAGSQAARLRSIKGDLDNARARSDAERLAVGAADPVAELRRDWQRK